jgi:hypothetical protein
MTIVPRLTLVGFSRLGCPLDAGIGGVVGYSTPIAPNAWLVASAGIFGTSTAWAKAPAAQSDARVDVIFQRPSGRAFGVGVDARQKGLTFTGQW